jgi:hypothetical protein
LIGIAVYHRGMPRLPVLAVAALIALALLTGKAEAEREALQADVERALEVWPSLQRADGAIPDYLHGNAAGRVRSYDEAILGYAMLMNAVRSGDESQAEAGFHAIAWAAGAYRSPGSVFESMAMASAYNFARTHFPADPRFQALRPGWEDWLRQVTPLRLTRRRAYYNMHLVEAVAFLELAQSGLQSPIPKTVLNSTATYRRAARRLINRQLPRLARRYTTVVGRRLATVLSDPPRNPLAYQGLTLGFLARATDLLGGEASKSARRLLVRMANASSALVAPDGDLAYTGRSQEQAWALTLTAYGALRAADSPRARRSMYLGLAARALGRLHRLHMGGPYGFAITPNFATNPDPLSYGIDDYASAGTYTGLAMTGALWTLDAGAGVVPGWQTGTVRSDRDSHARLSGSSSLFAVVTRARNWFAVRLRPAIPDEGDLRDDFGLVAWKVRDKGEWRTALPIRPYAKGEPTAGPLLRPRGKMASALPIGRRISVTRRGAVRVSSGGFVAGRRLIRRTAFVFVPGKRRIRVRFSVRRGDHVTYSLFLPAAGIAATPRGLSSPSLAVRGNAPARLSVAGTYASGEQHGLVRATLHYSIRRVKKLKLMLVRPR